MRYRLGTHITGQIEAGEYAGKVLFIPRILLSLTDAGLTFTLMAVSSTSSIRPQNIRSCVDSHQIANIVLSIYAEVLARTGLSL